MLNEAAQKLIFTLEKNYHGFGGGACTPYAPHGSTPVYVYHN